MADDKQDDKREYERPEGVELGSLGDLTQVNGGSPPEKFVRE